MPQDETAARELLTVELLTVKQFAKRFPAWTEASIRALIYASQDRVASGARARIIKGNGLRASGAVLNCRRRVLIDVQRFFGIWIAQQNRRRAE